MTEKENESNTSEGPTNVWQAPPIQNIYVDVEDLLQRAKAISSDVLDKSLVFILEEVKQDQKKRTVSVFVVDKRSRKSLKPTKNMVLRQISSLGVKLLAVIARTSNTFGDVLLPTAEEAVALTRKMLENKEYIFWTEYMGRRRTTVSI